MNRVIREFARSEEIDGTAIKKQPSNSLEASIPRTRLQGISQEAFQEPSPASDLIISGRGDQLVKSNAPFHEKM